MWELYVSKYRVNKLLECRKNVPTKICIPPHLFASTLNTLPMVKIKIEHGIHIVIHLFDSLDGNGLPVSTPILKPSSSSLSSPFVTPFICLEHLSPLIAPLPKPYISILPCLCNLAFVPRRKNIVKTLCK